MHAHPAEFEHDAPNLVSSGLLVLGGSGLVGSHVIRQVGVQGLRVQAWTRATAPPTVLAALADWQCGPDRDLRSTTQSLSGVTALVSAGPLDAFTSWFTRTSPVGVRRVVALSSTSAQTKEKSAESQERALAARLRHAEEVLIDHCDREGIVWTILRPTLIWGDGRDSNISLLANWMRRWRVLPLPRSARGLRQPIRGRDVAAALLATLACPAAASRVLDLPGGEALPYDEMARRIARALIPGGRVVRVPDLVVTTTAAVARALGLIGMGSRGALRRMGEDLAFAGEPAWDLLGFRPEGFQPTAEDFPAS